MRALLSVFLLPLALAFLNGCGGEGPNTQKVSLSYLPVLNQDVRCCTQIDNQTGDCTSYAVSPSANATITVVNDSDQWFGQQQSITVNGCSVEAVVPLGNTPPLLSSFQLQQVGGCSSTVVPPNGTGKVVFSLTPAFVSYLKQEWESTGLDALSYKLKISLDVKGEETGNYKKTVYLILNASDYGKNGEINPSPSDNLCGGGNL